MTTYSKKKSFILYKSEIKQNICRGFKISELKILTQIVEDRTSPNSIPTSFDVSTYQTKIVEDRTSPDSIPTRFHVSKYYIQIVGNRTFPDSISKRFHVSKYYIQITGDRTSSDSTPKRFHKSIDNNQAYKNNHFNSQSNKSI